MVDMLVEQKPYHHGDLSRALLEAAERVLERDGVGALSLRAVAREAGVSAAAPYHHFKDKDELLAGVARTGFDRMTAFMREAAEKVTDPRTRLTAIGVAYVRFALDNGALYHLMYDKSRRRDQKEDHRTDEGSGYTLVTRTIVEMAGSQLDPIDLELAQIAAWCAAYGLAEMADSKRFDELKARLGGDDAFFAAVFSHLGMYWNVLK